MILVIEFFAVAIRDDTTSRVPTMIDNASGVHPRPGWWHFACDEWMSHIATWFDAAFRAADIRIAATSSRPPVSNALVERRDRSARESGGGGIFRKPPPRARAGHLNLQATLLRPNARPAQARLISEPGFHGVAEVCERA